MVYTPAGRGDRGALGHELLSFLPISPCISRSDSDFPLMADSPRPNDRRTPGLVPRRAKDAAAPQPSLLGLDKLAARKRRESARRTALPRSFADPEEQLHLDGELVGRRAPGALPALRFPGPSLRVPSLSHTLGIPRSSRRQIHGALLQPKQKNLPCVGREPSHGLHSSA